MSPKVAVAVGAIIIFAAGIAAAEVIHAGRDSSSDATNMQRSPSAHRHRIDTASGVVKTRLPPATKTDAQPTSGAAVLKPGAEQSWAELAGSISGDVGIAVTPLGVNSTPVLLGSLDSGHAWSSIKVPILASLLRQQGEKLDGEEETWARAALTASDNEAAASLFARLEDLDGGLEGASLAVGEVLNEYAAEQTVVSTAPPPPGAFSSYGQTEWSLVSAAEFHAALGEGCTLGPHGTETALGLMEEVIPEQRWGLGEAGFPSGWHVAFKAGWGPEASASGAYLVRQNGIVRDSTGSVAVAMIALDDSGSFEAGAQDLTEIATWLRENLRTPLPAGSGC